MVFAVIGMLVAFVGLGVASIAAWKHTADRGRQLEKLAGSNGFSFSNDDLAGATGLPFQLFSEGDGTMVHNVITGRGSDGAPVRVFDFTYYIETKDPDEGLFDTDRGLKLEAGSKRRYHRFSCCVTEMPTAWPHLIIDPERLTRKILGKVGLRDVDIESETFNRDYAVTCEDRRFAELLIDPGIADLVIGTDKKFRFEIRGRWLMSATSRVPADLALPMVKLNEEFRRRIPQLLLAEYPEVAPEGTIGGWVGPERPGVEDHGISLGPSAS